MTMDPVSDIVEDPRGKFTGRLHGPGDLLNSQQRGTTIAQRRNRVFQGRVF